MSRIIFHHASANNLHPPLTPPDNREECRKHRRASALVKHERAGIPLVAAPSRAGGDRRLCALWPPRHYGDFRQGPKISDNVLGQRAG
jgi:hypothetical protein